MKKGLINNISKEVVIYLQYNVYGDPYSGYGLPFYNTIILKESHLNIHQKYGHPNANYAIIFSMQGIR